MSSLSSFILVDLVSKQRWPLPESVSVTIGSAADISIDGLLPQHLRLEVSADGVALVALEPARVGGKALDKGARVTVVAPLTIVVGARRLAVEKGAAPATEPLRSREFDVDALLPRGDSHSALEKLLYRAQVSLHPMQDPAQLFSAICDLALASTMATRAALLIQATSGELERKSARAVGAVSNEEFVVSSSVLKKLMRERKTVLVSDVSRSAEFSAQASLLSGHVQSALAAPIFDGETVLGVLYVDTRGEGTPTDPLGAEDASLLTVLAALAGAAIVAAQAIERVLQSEAALRDELARLKKGAPR